MRDLFPHKKVRHKAGPVPSVRISACGALHGTPQALTHKCTIVQDAGIDRRYFGSQATLRMMKPKDAWTVPPNAALRYED